MKKNVTQTFLGAVKGLFSKGKWKAFKVSQSLETTQFHFGYKSEARNRFSSLSNEMRKVVGVLLAVAFTALAVRATTFQEAIERVFSYFLFFLSYDFKPDDGYARLKKNCRICWRGISELLPERVATTERKRRLCKDKCSWGI